MDDSIPPSAHTLGPTSSQKFPSEGVGFNPEHNRYIRGQGKELRGKLLRGPLLGIKFGNSEVMDKLIGC